MRDGPALRGFRARPTHQPRRPGESLADRCEGCLDPMLFPIYRILRPREFKVSDSPCLSPVGGSLGGEDRPSRWPWYGYRR